MFVKLSHVQNLLCCSTLVVFAAYATSTYSHQSSVHISHYVFKKREFVNSSWFCPYLSFSLNSPVKMHLFLDVWMLEHVREMRNLGRNF